MKRLLVLLAGFAVLAAAAAAGAGDYATRAGVPAGAEYVGSSTCLDCHDDAGAFYHGTPHSVERGLVVPGTSIYSCEACHGPGSLHVNAGGDGPILGVSAIEAMSPDLRAEMCLQCHVDKRSAWPDSPHAGTEADCSACHGDVVHSGTPVKAFSQFRVPGEFCIQCHADRAADFRLPFRHRVLEGEVSCLDCHDVHGAGPTGDPASDFNTKCLGCHTEMAGPFVFEHEGVSGEECTYCHQPHGSINDKLLTQDSNSLCLQCHYEPSYPVIGGRNHEGYLSREARCYGCHHEIHGSNLNPAFLDQGQ